MINTNKKTGFTLIEMAVVLVIMGIILSGIVGTFSARIQGSRVKATQQTLNDIKEALLGFAMLNGRLPCPVSIRNLPPLPPPLTDGDGKSDPQGSGACDNEHGYIPTYDLGLKGKINDENIILDAWGNPIRYSVKNATSTLADSSPGTDNRFTISSVATAWKEDDIIATDPLFSVHDPDIDSTCVASNGNERNKVTAAIILSTGKNGKDTASYSSLETENTSSNGIFILTQFKGQNHTCPYDDMMEWISLGILKKKLNDAGKLQP